MKPLHHALAAVTDRIRDRSASSRQAYLARVEALRQRPRGADRMGGAHVAHAFAARPGDDTLRIVAQ